MRAWAHVGDREEEPVSEPARLTGEPLGSLQVRRLPPTDIVWGPSWCLAKAILGKKPVAENDDCDIIYN
jgi:hypothetical protein